MKSKKIILFIAEGITDKTCLGYILSQLLSNQNVQFELTHGDITTEISNTPSNISARIGDIVKNFSGNIFKAKDFLEVVHLVDMDGAYISDEHIIQSHYIHPYYTTENIESNNIEIIKKRNKQKSCILNRLITMKKVWKTIPYSVYFFSCNLDHVLHDHQNLPGNEKDKYADNFEKKYAKYPEQFINFISNSEFTVNGHFNETWDFIKLNSHSLKRYTNFHLYFNEPKNIRN